MKKPGSNLILVIILVCISAIVYISQILIFKRKEDTFFYFLQDVAFLPVQAFIVTFILNRIITSREKKERLRKMNMAINAFFGEAGTDMILLMNDFILDLSKLNVDFDISGRWNDKKFKATMQKIHTSEFAMDSRSGNLDQLKTLLISKRPFLLSMLENSNLLEHDTFSDMLWAVFHLTDELVARKSLDNLPSPDLDHLSLDIFRTYSTILLEWMSYLAHLKTDYPYLYSMAVRINPFKEDRSVIFK